MTVPFTDSGKGTVGLPQTQLCGLQLRQQERSDSQLLVADRLRPPRPTRPAGNGASLTDQITSPRSSREWKLHTGGVNRIKHAARTLRHQQSDQAQNEGLKRSHGEDEEDTGYRLCRVDDYDRHDGWCRPAAPSLPDGFVYLDKAIPGLVIDLRYVTNNNFVGQPIDGYRHGHVILSAPGAAALSDVQARLRRFGLELKVFDAYRPQRAVDHFVRWGKDLDDQRTKSDYYPDIPKEDLFKQGYIASRSSHSRGSTVDVTIVYRDEAGAIRELDMGSRFDFFDPISWPDSLGISAQQRANRVLLRSLMMANGFVPYGQEWWHFTLKAEPYPNTYFDFSNQGR